MLVSLANTGEALYLVNRSGNRPSSEGAAERFDQAGALCQAAGFRRITFRGDTDFSQTAHLDRWDGGYFFYLTNDRETAIPELVFLANARCNQENLIDQLKHGVGPETGRWATRNAAEKAAVMGMEFKAFLIRSCG